MSRFQKLALGTAHFGLDYGISNKNGKVSRDEAIKILNLGHQLGIDTLDTAIAYGDSEMRLGNIGVKKHKVITKLPPMPDSLSDTNFWINQHVQRSLERLKSDTLYGVLLHRSDDWNGSRGKDVRHSLLKLQERGVIKKIGISIYSPDELNALDDLSELGIVQAPFNLLDRRLHTSGWLKQLHELGAEIHVRSIFLQGLLLVPKSEIPIKFSRWNSLWNEWHEWLADRQNLNAVSVCIKFVQSFLEIDRIIVGVNTRSQLQEICKYLAEPNISTWPEICSEDERLVHPFNWAKL